MGSALSPISVNCAPARGCIYYGVDKRVGTNGAAKATPELANLRRKVAFVVS